MASRHDDQTAGLSLDSPGDPRPITEADRVKLKEAGNGLHFNAILHQIGSNSVAELLECSKQWLYFNSALEANSPQ